MANTQTPIKVIRHYYYDKSTQIIYFSEKTPDDSLGLTFLGTSNNPKPASAATAFIQGGKVKIGYKLVNLD